jgi:hypothetical protein
MWRPKDKTRRSTSFAARHDYRLRRTIDLGNELLRRYGAVALVNPRLQIGRGVTSASGQPDRDPSMPPQPVVRRLNEGKRQCLIPCLRQLDGEAYLLVVRS